MQGGTSDETLHVLPEEDWDDELRSFSDWARGKGVKRVTYYDLAGRSSATPHQGVNVVVILYTDGTKRVTKVVK